MDEAEARHHQRQQQQQQQQQPTDAVVGRPNLFPYLTHNEATVLIWTRAYALESNCKPMIDVLKPTTPEELPSWVMKVAHLELMCGKLDDERIDRQGQSVRVGDLLLRRDY